MSDTHARTHSEREARVGGDRENHRLYLQHLARRGQQRAALVSPPRLWRTLPPVLPASPSLPVSVSPHGVFSSPYFAFRSRDPLGGCMVYSPLPILCVNQGPLGGTPQEIPPGRYPPEAAWCIALSLFCVSPRGPHTMGMGYLRVPQGSPGYPGSIPGVPWGYHILWVVLSLWIGLKSMEPQQM